MLTTSWADASPAGRDAIARHRRRTVHRGVVDVALALACAGLGATLGMAVTAESRSALAAPGGLDTAIGRVAGLSGAYLMLVQLLLMARIPLVERAVGQDRLAGWHRRLGPWPIVLIVVHATFITFGYAEAAHTGFWRQAGQLLLYYPDVLAAAAAASVLVGVGLVSARIARRRMRYETWWVVHLYVYLALALAFAHQIATGASFVGHPLARTLWAVAWAGSAGTVLVFRILVPLGRSLRHQLKVVVVRDEGNGVVSLVLRGRRLERLRVEGGQFFQWRFLTRELWWQAHPYSLSALPSPPYLRVTVRGLGDHSRSLARVPVGTKVAIEGPYGAFTAPRRQGDRVLLVGAGVGVTPIRAMLEALPPHVDAVVIVRASTHDDLVLQAELSGLVQARQGTMHEVVGSRHAVDVDHRLVQRLVPDVAARDVYVCAPDPFADRVVAAVLRLGVPEERIHREAFSF